jgi:uncharacterized membrane protein YdjX (TVP38/TMEM64 family)
MSFRARLLPLAALLAALAAAWLLGLPRLLSWPALAANRAALDALVAAHPLPAALGFVLIYTVTVALSLPGAAVLSVAGGLLFGTLAGAALAVTGASAGAVLLFLAARHALAPAMEARAGALLGRIRPGLERDGFSYLLALRLMPVFPFWLVNLAPALAGMRLAPFAAATVIGIIPGALVFASIGSGVGHVLDAGRAPDLSEIFSAPVLGPLAGLAALALLPVAWRWWRRRGTL